MAEARQRMASALGVSLGYHAMVIVLVVIAIRSGQRAAHVVQSAWDRSVAPLVWLSDARPPGGGGGGGNRMKSPPRRAESPGDAALTVPVVRPVRLVDVRPEVEPNPLERLVIPVEPLAAGIVSMPGAIFQASSDPTSQGPGSGGGARNGDGPGDGDGRGRGAGPGFEEGVGGERGGGAGVVMPRVLREVKPQYTAGAMNARVQGSVLLACVVQPDGSVGDVRVLRSLDPVLGLDQEAIKAARQWRFLPGTRFGKAVPVRVTIELVFTIR